MKKVVSILLVFVLLFLIIPIGAVSVMADSVCQHEYAYPCDDFCILCGNREDHSGLHRIVCVEAKEPTCTNGNVEYYFCDVCGVTWLDEACTMLSNQKSVILPRINDHVYTDATCFNPKICMVCGETSGEALGHTYKTVTEKATLTANGYILKRCSGCGEETGKKTLYKVTSITLSETSFTNNGKVQKPTVIVKDANGTQLTEGTSYVVTYDSGCKEVGTYKVTVTMKGNYSGSKILYFTISCKHTYKAATCTKPKTCEVCGATSGSPLGHAFDSAYDDTCDTCGYTRIINHDYNAATCTKPKTCKVCGKTSGDALGHSYKAATCTKPKTCKTCGATSGKALSHSYKAATCTKPKTCKTCGVTSGKALGHTYKAATCTKPKTCKTCGATSGKALGHSYKAATCTTPKTCKTCGITSGKALGHKYSADCDNTCNRCSKKRNVSFEHQYTDWYCDRDCDLCGATRTAPHYYFDSCDIDCNLCGKVRKITHTYTNDCDEYCNICQEYREVKDHRYTNKCDRDCNECGVRRTVTHKYSNKCDNTCNLCGSKRKVATHVYKTAVGKPATLTANGYSIKTCVECKKTTGDKTVIRKVGHIKLSTTTYTYDGKVKKPTVTIKDSYGNKIASSNYTITYASGLKNVGTYKVTIKFKGNYSGTKTLTFKINPPKTGISKLTAGKKSLTVAITKKTAQASGYEVQYSTSKSFKTYKTKTLTSYKKTSATLTGLKAKTTYYVRVRTYKTVNGKKVYSAWSTVKSLKTK